MRIWKKKTKAQFNEPNKYDAYIKIKSVMKSCKNYQQLSVAERMIHLHYEMFGDDFLWNKLNWDSRFIEEELTKQE